MHTLNTTKTTADLLAEQIRNAILIGEYAEGVCLKQDELATRFKVSKIPVREALYQLKSEGLVAFQNNRGSRVAALSIQQVEEIYTMRIALETIALQRAIPNLSAEHTLAAENALKLTEASNDALRWGQLNWEFHAQIYRAANMPLLLQTVATLHNNVARYLLLYLKTLNFQHQSQTEHWALLASCKAGKVEQACGILRQHLQDALNQTIEFMTLREQP